MCGGKKGAAEPKPVVPEPRDIAPDASRAGSSQRRASATLLSSTGDENSLGGGLPSNPGGTTAVLGG